MAHVAAIVREAFRLAALSALLGAGSTGIPSADAADAAEATMPPRPTESAKEITRYISEHLEPARDGQVIFLKLRGGFELGLPDGGSIVDPDPGAPAISPAAVHFMLEACRDRNPRPQAVVLDIQSAGGFVFVLEEIIDLLAGAENDGLRVVAWPREMTGSAAALLTLACKEIVVHPTVRLGAATKVDGSGEAVEGPKTASDFKGAAMAEGRERRTTERTKRNPLLCRAMCEPPMLLYFREGVFLDSLPPGEDWLALDTDDKKPLVMTGQAMVDTKVALKDMASDEAGVLRALGLAGGSVVRIDLASFASDDDRTSLREAMKHWRAWTKAAQGKVRQFLAGVSKEREEILAVLSEVQHRGDLGQTISHDQQERLIQLVGECDKLPKSRDEDLAELRELGGAEWSNKWRQACHDVSLAIVGAREVVGPIGRHAADRLSERPDDLEKVVDGLAKAEKVLAVFLSESPRWPGWLWRFLMPISG